MRPPIWTFLRCRAFVISGENAGLSREFDGRRPDALPVTRSRAQAVYMHGRQISWLNRRSRWRGSRWCQGCGLPISRVAAAARPSAADPRSRARPFAGPVWQATIRAHARYDPQRPRTGSPSRVRSPGWSSHPPSRRRRALPGSALSHGGAGQSRDRGRHVVLGLGARRKTRRGRPV
jgi:hypothetical protein